MLWRARLRRLRPCPAHSRHLHGKSGNRARWHLFGLKSQAIAIAAQHPRVASADSQAYGIAARQDARKARTSKTDAMIAAVMTRWYRQQMRTIAASATGAKLADHSSGRPVKPDRGPHRRRQGTPALAARTRETDWTDVSPQRAYEMAFLDD